MSQIITLTGITFGTTHDDSTTYKIVPSSGNVVPHLGITKTQLQDGIVLTFSDDTITEANVEVQNGLCVGSTALMTWTIPITPTPTPTSAPSTPTPTPTTTPTPTLTPTPTPTITPTPPPTPSGPGVWSSAASMITARTAHTSTGTQDDSLVWSGISTQQSTEIYNGVTDSWATGNNLPSPGYSRSGFGTSNAARSVGGTNAANTNLSFDGTSWTSETSLPTGSGNPEGSGTQNASIVFGGQPTYVQTQLYDGTSWTSGGDLILGREYLTSTGEGTQNATLAIGGSRGNRTNTVESYDGVGWSTAPTIPIATSHLGGAGTQNSAIAMGGLNPGFTSATYEYNGVTWSTGNSISSPRYTLSANGSGTSALVTGGTTPSGNVSTVEKYNK